MKVTLSLSAITFNGEEQIRATGAHGQNSAAASFDPRTEHW